MKAKLILLHVFFLTALLGIVLSAVMGNHLWITLGFSGVTLALSVIIFKSWMKFIHRVVLKSDQILFHQSEQSSLWSFTNLERIERNQELVAKKFEVSADLIANLSHPEKVGAAADLIATDPIGKALNNIRQEMQRLKDEDEKQAWITTGLAQFSTILRQKAETKEYSHRIISNLVKYLGANQGGLFIEYRDSENERYLELAACYAYDKRKFLESKIAPGQGLLGQCMFEKDFIFITDVPKDYVKITSGLGMATPRNIVVAPLIFNDVFCGAIELALFEVMKPHQVEFLKKVCENIASEITSLKNIAHTERLLEDSNVLTQELQSREEEMKQNLEELAATQEEMARKQAELAGVINAIDSTLATAELDRSGNLLKYNSILEQFVGYTPQQLKTFDFRLLVGNQTTDFWDAVVQGEIKSGDYKTKNAQGADLWLSITFTAIQDASGNTARVLCMIQDITLRKSKEQEFERLSLVANNTDNAVLITDKFGITEYVNEGFIKMTGYQPHEIIGKNPGKVLQGEDTDKDTIERIRTKLKRNEPIYEEILNFNSVGQPYWVSLAINPVFNKEGELERFISIQANITETKNASLDYRFKLEAIGRSNAIIEFDTEGFILDANENFLRLAGYSLEELVGKHHRIFVKPEEASLPSYAAFWKRLGKGEFVSDEFARITKAGNTIWLKGIYNPIHDMHGKPKKIVKFAVDITEEKRLEIFADRKDRELNSYLAGINNTIASAEFDLKGTFQGGNDIFQKVMGFETGDLIGKKFDFFMGDDPSVIMMWENLKLGKFFSGEFKMRDAAGKDLWLTGTFNPIIVEGDAPEKIMMFAQFTTQEKEKLNDLNGMVQALKSTLPVLEFNDRLACKTANEKAMKIFGLSRMDLRNKTMMDFIAPCYHAAWKKKEASLLQQDFATLLLPISMGEHIQTYEVSVSVAKNLEGKVMKVIVILVKEVQEQVSMLAAV